MIETFKKEVDAGLSAENKSLPSKYFYDKKGDDLFVEIMNLPEYYLTRSELEIFTHQTEALVQSLQINAANTFEVVELGAGDGTKTRYLLQQLLKNNLNFSYQPIDISINALDQLKNKLTKEFRELEIKTQQGDYFEVLKDLKKSNQPKIILFLGSNIGNMCDCSAKKFLQQLSDNLNAGDKLILGLDLIKSKHIVLPAYNDSRGVTSKFNLNLLDRINKDLRADFKTEAFYHQPDYEEHEGIAKSYLVSREAQKVTIQSLGKEYYFKKGEKIHTEISRKYNETIVNEILKESGLQIVTHFKDSKGYFADYVIEKI